MKFTEIPLSHAKTTIPGRRPRIVSRARLLAKLDELLEKQLVFVTAPAGYGKTTLLVDLAHTTGMPVCWLSLDTLDQEPQRFLAYFLASISQRFPRFGNQSNAALKNIVALEGSLENLIITIANEVEENIRQHFVLILDDYQLVDGIPEIRNFVGRFVQLVGENSHLILASRRLPTLPDLTVLVARQQVGGFDLDELAFQPDEIHQLFEQGYGVTLDDAEVEELARRTEGWITGLHLVRLDNTRGLPDLTRAARAVGVDLADYFDQQVLSQLSPKVCSFLLQTSLLEEFDAALCDSVLGVGDWRAIMVNIRHGNLFAQSVGLRGEWMRYHALFRDFLQERIRQESPETAQAILLRLAEVSEENGDWEKAHYALAQAGDLNALAALVGRAGRSLVQNGRILTLSAWLDELPESMVQLSPHLLLLAGIVSLVKGQVQYGLFQIDRVEAMFRFAGDRTNLAVALVRRSWAHRLLGGYELAVADAGETIRLLAGKSGQEIILAEANRMKGLALFRLGRLQESEKCLELALEMFIQLHREKDIPLVQMELGMVRRAHGDTSSALVYYEKALIAWQEQGNLTSQATLQNSLGVLYHTRGEYEKAVQAFEKGLDCALQSGYIRSRALILASLGDTYTDINDLDAASLLYQQSYDIAVQTADHFLTNYARISLAGVTRLKGDLEQARLLLETARSSLRDIGSHSEIGLLALESGCLYLASGFAAQAVPDLRLALENFEQGSLRVEVSRARLWLAAALVQAGDAESARLVVDAALCSVDGSDPPPSFLLASYHVRAWIGRLEDVSPRGAQLHLLLEQADNFHRRIAPIRGRLHRHASVVPAGAPDLAIRAFGRSAVRVKGRAVTSTQWQTKSVKELFFLFVAASRPLTKEQIGEILWPESAPDQLKLRFKNDLYRLRRAVGPDVILFDGRTYRFNRELDFEFDVHAFENSLSRARSARDTGQRLRSYQEAVAAVHGPYLEEIDSPWVLADREHYRKQYLAALLALAGLLLEQKDTEEALKICQHALASDNAFEEAYQLTMRIHAARGDRMGITHQYQACQAALEKELGVTPSLETEVLYHQLTS